VQQERALDADAVRGDAADGEVGLRPALAQADHRALKHLHALAVAFHDQGVDAHRIARPKLGQVGLLLHQGINDIHRRQVLRVTRKCRPSPAARPEYTTPTLFRQGQIA